MITAPPFTIDLLRTAKVFFALRTISADNIEIVRRTPAGDDPFQHANVWRMQNSQLVVTLDNPFTYLGNQVLIAKSGDIEEIINIEQFERVIEFYDRAPEMDTSKVGVFVFCKSEPIFDPVDKWRCDKAMYGSRPYIANSMTGTKLVGSPTELIMYESMLTVPALGHLIYVHLKNDEENRRDFIDHAELPAGTYTLGEMFKLLHEWSIVADAPFNNSDSISSDARGFLNAIGFDQSLIADQPDMQIASFLKGKTDARTRPLNVPPTSPALLHFVRERLAFSSLSALSLVFPGLVDTAEVLKEEQRQLAIGMNKFRDYYQVGVEISMDNVDSFMAEALKTRPIEGPFLHNRLRLLRNKKAVLDRVANDSL